MRNPAEKQIVDAEAVELMAAANQLDGLPEIMKTVDRVEGIQRVISPLSSNASVSPRLGSVYYSSAAARAD